ncbi:DUF4177 domain-containing protein [Clostridium bowmanii]|uniref:DUF4177 domain-containing protein n=1 Tax=Clostridium bowmanii TaxID=132925 RepID=UPI001CD383AF|nr:DUF4177 domain-containing protein [Clostridium bowmanii]MCA1072746.1 DUF4177 domain-containing protein [Clostridium bowmanii]
MGVLDKWEYTSIKTEAKGFMGGILDISHFDNELNSLGEQGWELVSCFSTTQDGGKCREIIAVFKRMK